MQKQNILNHAKLKFSELIQYSFGGLGSNMMWNFVGIYLMFFFTDIFKISPAVTGTIFMITRIIDAITDPLMGMIADRTKSKYGRYRPYLIIFSPFLGICVAMLFWAPNLTPTSKIIYAYFVYILYSLVSTAVNVPYHALTPVMSHDVNERANIVVGKQLLGLVGNFIVTVFPLIIVEKLGGGVEGWRVSGIIFGVVATIAYWICAYGARNKDIINNDIIKGKEKIKFKDQVKLITKNKALIMLLIAGGTNKFSEVIAGGVGLYYFKYNLGRVDLFPKFQGYGTIVSIIAYLLIPILIKKISKNKMFVIASYLGVIVSAIPLLFSSQLDIGIIFGILILEFLLIQFTSVLVWAMLPDCVEYGEYVTGIRGDATISSTNMFMNKIGAALAGGIAGAALEYAGYIPEVSQTSKVLITILILKFFTIILGHVFSILAFLFYPLTPEYYDKITKELEERKLKSK